MSKPPREILSPIKVFNDVHPAPRAPNEMPTPRVMSPLPTIAKAIIDTPIHNKSINSKVHKARKEPSFEQTKLQLKINEVKNNRAQITQQTHMQI
jgi:hypothetical protein